MKTLTFYLTRFITAVLIIITVATLFVMTEGSVGNTLACVILLVCLFIYMCMMLMLSHAKRTVVKNHRP